MLGQPSSWTSGREGTLSPWSKAQVFGMHTVAKTRGWKLTNAEISSAVWKVGFANWLAPRPLCLKGRPIRKYDLKRKTRDVECGRISFAIDSELCRTGLVSRFDRWPLEQSQTTPILMNSIYMFPSHFNKCRCLEGRVRKQEEWTPNRSLHHEASRCLRQRSALAPREVVGDSSETRPQT